MKLNRYLTTPLGHKLLIAATHIQLPSLSQVVIYQYTVSLLKLPIHKSLTKITTEAKLITT